MTPVSVKALPCMLLGNFVAVAFAHAVLYRVHNVVENFWQRLLPGKTMPNHVSDLPFFSFLYMTCHLHTVSVHSTLLDVRSWYLPCKASWPD